MRDHGDGWVHRSEDEQRVVADLQARVKSLSVALEDCRDTAAEEGVDPGLRLSRVEGIARAALSAPEPAPEDIEEGRALVLEKEPVDHETLAFLKGEPAPECATCGGTGRVLVPVTGGPVPMRARVHCDDCVTECDGLGCNRPDCPGAAQGEKVCACGQFRDSGVCIHTELNLPGAVTVPAGGGAAEAFRITWRGGAYYVSIPNYDGGDVLPLEAHKRLVTAAVAAEREALLVCVGLHEFGHCRSMYNDNPDNWCPACHLAAIRARGSQP